MTPDQARRALATWTDISDSRNALVQAALDAGVTKMEVFQVTGIARTTIDRIDGQPRTAFRAGSAAYLHVSDQDLATRMIAMAYPLAPDPLRAEFARRFPQLEVLEEASLVLQRLHDQKTYPDGRPPLAEWPGEAAPGLRELADAYREAVQEIAAGRPA